MLQRPEEWRPVIGFNGLYEVSDRGRVRSVKRSVRYTSRYGTFLMKFNGKILQQNSPNRAGHLSVCLSKNNKQHLRWVHRLVLESFVGIAPKNMQCRHLDGVPTNNMLSNLRWGTHLEDRADMLCHGTRQTGEKHHAAKLTIKDILYIRGSKKRGLAKEFGVSRTTVSRIKKRQAWMYL